MSSGVAWRKWGSYYMCFWGYQLITDGTAVLELIHGMMTYGSKP